MIFHDALIWLVRNVNEHIKYFLHVYYINSYIVICISNCNFYFFLYNAVLNYVSYGMIILEINILIEFIVGYYATFLQLYVTYCGIIRLN